MHHLHADDFVFWFFSISTERSNFVYSITFFVPFIPTFWELKEMDFNLEFFGVVIEIPIDNDSYIPFAL